MVHERVFSLPDDLYRKLKFSAALNHTTVEKQAVAYLEKVLMSDKGKSKGTFEKGVTLIDQMGFSYNSSDLKAYLNSL